MLPNFLIVGPPKCGTTSLQLYLNKHPEIFARGETHFFSHHYEKGMEWYEQLFSKWNGQKAVGEKSPSYFRHPEAAKRIKNHFPDIKLIFIFRDPVDRAYSQYWHEVRKGREDASSFEKTLEKELKGKNGGESKYLEISKYIVYLEKWCNYFSETQMFFLTMEELNLKVLREILTFLNVDRDFQFGELKKYNIGGEPRSIMLSKISQHRGIKMVPYLSDFINRVINMQRGKYPMVKRETRIRLQNYFKPYNQELEELTGLDLSKWRETRRT